MPIKSYTTQLEEVQLAIAKIEGSAQSYSIGNRSLTRAKLADLYTREKWLRTMAAREEDSNKLNVSYGMPE